MTKTGIVKAKFSRRPQNGWKLKRATVGKTRTGKYYCCILYECAVKEPEPITPTPERTVGLKYSVPHFYAADDGSLANPAHWMRQSREKLLKLQKKLDRMQPGSKNYRETVQKYRLMHEHIANQRRDFIHKESRRIANAWDAVCVRDDDLGEIARGLTLGDSRDSGFGMFREFLRYKLERQGKTLIVVDRYTPTTRTCSVCGHVREAVHLRETKWACPECGTMHDREINAAKNIKALGLAQYFCMQARRESA